jgi:putative transposase
VGTPGDPIQPRRDQHPAELPAARQCRLGRKLKAADVIDVLSDLFILRGVPAHIRSDSGPEFVARTVQGWITAVGARTAYISPRSPWENGYVESFNARLRDELLDGEIFYSLREAEVVIESWRRHYNSVRPHASLGFRPPAPEVVLPASAAWPVALRRPALPTTQVVARRPALNYHSTRTIGRGPITPSCDRGESARRGDCRFACR